MNNDKMQAYLWDLPSQFRQALTMELDFPASYHRRYRNIVISGLGGSAIGGDITRSYALPRASLPIIVNRDYELPAFVDQDTLVFSVSYSGNTEETLSCYYQARCQQAAIVAITSGGKLASEAQKDGCMVLKMPAGLAPRAANGYLLAPLILSLEKLGILTGVTADIEETVQVLEGLRAGIHPGVDENQAKVLAREIKGHIPLIWGSAANSEVAAWRWKTQINENAKCPAFFNVFPELNHNEIVGFEVAKDLLSRLVVIILRDQADKERIKKRMEISRGIIQNRVQKVIEVDSQGQSWLARFYSLVYLGDYTSYYLAQEYGIDPEPVKVIDYLKAELARE